MININELKGYNLKKDLELRRVLKRWHNKNTRGGNFGINLMTNTKPDYEITGYHNLKGEITNLSVGELYQCGTTMFTKDTMENWNYERLINLLNKLINKKTEEVKLLVPF